MKLFKKWDSKDYKWLIFYILSAFALALIWRLNDNDSVVNIISMIASGSSIALAVMAMVQSTVYNDRSNDTYIAITEKLSKLEHNTDDIKERIIDNVNRVNKDIENNDKIDFETKIELQSSMNSIASLIGNNEEMKSIRKIISKELGRRIRTIYDFDEVLIGDSLYGNILMCINNKSGKLIEIELIYFENDDNLNYDMHKHSIEYCKKINRGKYAILISKDVPENIFQNYQPMPNLFKLRESDISEMRDDELKSVIELKFD